MSPDHAQLDLLEARQEAELIGAAQTGDHAAFLGLVRHYQRPLYRLSYATSRSEGEAEALAQEVFARAWRDIKIYPSGRKFFFWLLRILRDLPRKVAPKPSEQAPEDPLRAGIEALRADDRMALALRNVEHIRYQEIAALLDVPTGIVILRISQARGSLLAADPEGRAA